MTVETACTIHDDVEIASKTSSYFSKITNNTYKNKAKSESRSATFFDNENKINFTSIFNYFVPNQTAISIVSSRVIAKKIDSSFTCVISSIDMSTQTIEARVYENSDNVFVMDIEAPIANFEPSDAELIRENAVFYWTVGTRRVEKVHNNRKVKVTNENFSDFKLRRIYTSSLFLKNDIEALTNKYSEFFRN